MAQEERKSLVYFRFLWKNKKFIFRVVFIVGIISIIISLLLPKYYRATAVIMPPEESKSAFTGLGIDIAALGLGDIFGGGEDIFRYTAILKSRTLLEAVNRKFNFQKKYKTKNLEETIKALRENLYIRIGEESQIEVSFLDRDQDLVADITNYIVHCLDSLNIALTTQKAHNNREFIEERLKITLDSLKTVETELSNFMKANSLISIDDQVRVAVEQAAELQAQIMAKEIELRLKKDALKSNHPEVEFIQKELDALKQKLNQLYRGELKQKIFPAFDKVQDLEIQYLQLQRKVLYYSKVIEFLGPQYEQARIEEARKIPTIQILDPAVRPERKAKPKRSIFVILMTFTGFLGSIVYLVVRDRFSDLKAALDEK